MTFTSKKNQQLVTDIVKQLFYKKSLSLTELSKLTGKSSPLVTSMVSKLIEGGFVVEQGLAPSTGGRRPSTYLINPALGKYIIAVAMDQLTSRIAIYNLAGEQILEADSIELDLKNSADAIPQLVSYITNSIQKANIPLNNIIGVGIGIPGFVNTDEGLNHTFLKVANNTSLSVHLAEHLGLPVFIDNDSSLIALAELKFGKAIGKQNVMVVNVGWGTGLGMIIDGKLYRGNNGYAGEFSHIPLSPNNDLCSCGKTGCLEVDTSLLVMIKNAKKAIASGQKSILGEWFKSSSKPDLDIFLDAIKNHDPLAISILSKAAFQIGKGVATLIHILNPELLVLSGRGAQAGKQLLPGIQQAINEFCIPRIADCTKIEVSKLGAKAELLASASLVIERMPFYEKHIQQVFIPLHKENRQDRSLINVSAI